MSKTIQLKIDDNDWEPSSDPKGDGRLYLTVEIGGAFHHLEALPVDNGAGLCGATPIVDEMLDDLYNAFGSEGPFYTTTIKGREYAIFMSPFCQ